MKPSHRQRNVTIIDLPLQDVVPMHPEQVILRFPSKRTIDIGALCYLRRHFDRSIRKRNGYKVDPSSLKRDRLNRVGSLIQYISDLFSSSGLREATILDRAKRFAAFVSWADANNGQDVLDSAEMALKVFRDYLLYLKEKVAQNALSINGAARQQNVVLTMLSGFLNGDDLSLGLDLLQTDWKAKKTTLPPSEDAMAKSMSMCEALFDGIVDFLLSGKPYLHRIELPKYLDWQDNGIWILPSVRMFIVPHDPAYRPTGRYNYHAYDFANGRLADFETVFQSCKSKAYARSCMRSARRVLAASNMDLHCYHRRTLGVLAQKAFLLMFIAQTAMNTAQVVALPWSADYDVTEERQRFRSIKWRAGNRTVHFETTSAFLPRFESYLKLRDYLLDGLSCDFLFFSCGPNLSHNPEKLPFIPHDLFRTLRRIDPNLSNVLPRELRASKSDWLIRNTDPATAAMVLQNSEKTVLRAYAAGSETLHMEEMSNFFNLVADVVLNNGKAIDHGVDCALGLCSSYHNPHSSVLMSARHCSNTQTRANRNVLPECMETSPRIIQYKLMLSFRRACEIRQNDLAERTYIKKRRNHPVLPRRREDRFSERKRSFRLIPIPSTFLVFRPSRGQDRRHPQRIESRAVPFLRLSIQPHLG